ncbi:MAG: aspartate aminotransferase family protein [Flavobacteriaceae bacterium]
MSKSLLKAAYSTDNFRTQGHQLIDILADHLDNTLKGNSDKVINWSSPEDERAFWTQFLKGGDSSELFNEIINRSIHIHHPNYMGHQISPTVPITALTSVLSAQLNNGMGVYEMGAAPTAMERIVTDLLCAEIGYHDNANGFLTSGGTLANLTALLSARRKIAKEDVWQKGNLSKLAIMVSEEAHYCVDRAARIMGLGQEGIIKVPVDQNFELKTELLQQYYDDAVEKGIEIFAVVGSAPSTATGIYDPLTKLSAFAKENGIWFHVDGAHGGAAIFSKKYRSLVKGIQQADSVVIDGHKMMMMPSITTALLFKNGQDSHETFMQKADYLLQASEEEDWYNLAKRTFECTKYMMSLHWFTLFKQYGSELFDDFVTVLYDLGHQFADLITKDPDFDLAVSPMSNIVCFRYVGAIESTEEQNQLNRKIRQQILEEGKYYIVQTKLNNLHYLRVTFMNPFTTESHMEGLLSAIRSKIKSIQSFKSLNSGSTEI